MGVDVQARSLDRYRDYLGLLVRVQVGGSPRARMDPSDIVQQTLLQAHRAMGEFQGRTDGELMAWLRKILARVIAHTARDLGRAKRNVARERSLEDALSNSSTRLEAWLAAGDSSPSQRADRNEQVRRLAAALGELPEAQRDALILHYLQGKPLAEIAERMGRTPGAVGALLQRGLKRLRGRLGGPCHEQ
jgi:RNA polymerase sigma-70 factor (ECF subfamily)